MSNEDGIELILRNLSFLKRVEGLMPKSIRKLFSPAMTKKQFPSELLARDIILKSLNRISTPFRFRSPKIYGFYNA